MSTARELYEAGGCAAMLFGFVCIMLLCATLATLPVWAIWNHVVIDLVPGLKPCTIFQAFCLSIFMSCFGKSPPSAEKTQ